MIRVRVEPPLLAAGEIRLGGDAHHYLGFVRRVRPGDPLLLFDGAGRQARAIVVAVDREVAVVRADAATAVPSPSPAIAVLQPLIKGDRLDWCVEKLVEVGVNRITLVSCQRAVVRLDPERAAARQRRLSALAEAAARQSGRADVPVVSAVIPFAEAVRAAAGQRLLCLPGAEAGLVTTPRAGDAVLAVGPEGGFAPEEIDLATAAGFTPVTLGPSVLRAETAGPVAVAALRMVWLG